MQTNDLPRIGVLGADPAAVTQFLRRVQALGADPAALLPLKIPASLFNAAAAIAAAPPLCLAIRAALRRAHLRLE